MEEKDGTVDIIISSLRYPFTNIGSIIIGGIVFLFSFILIGIPFILGYWVRIGRETLKHNETMPAWNDFEGLLSDGFRAFIISIIYGVMIFIVEIIYFIAILAVDLGLHNNPAGSILRIVLYMIFLVATFPLTTLLYISYMILADTSDLSKAIDPRNGLKIFLDHPKNFIIAFIVNLIVQLMILVPIMLIFWLAIHQIYCICLIVLALPWMLFIMTCIGYHIFARYYRRVVYDEASVQKDGNVPLP